ncbi:MAG: hypothetical protein ACON31_06825 [Candidatus Puniceispirillaceae bacterium]
MNAAATPEVSATFFKNIIISPVVEKRPATARRFDGPASFADAFHPD